jgi:RND family efflux transporter MFP subunit
MNTPVDHSKSSHGENAGAPVHERETLAVQLNRTSAMPDNRMGWKLAVFSVVLGAGLLIGFYLVHHHRSKEEAELADQTNLTSSEPATVDTVYVKPAPTSQPLQLPGETQGWYQSVIYARVNGYVDKWTADIGDKVHKGDVLATISTPDLDAQLKASIEQLSVAQSEIGVAQANAAFADTTFKRWHDSPKGVVAEQETEEKKAGYNSSVAQLKAAQAKASAAEAEVSRLQALEDYKEVDAPFNGIITSRRIDIGNLVTAGSTTNTSPLYDIAQADTIRVFVDVPQDVSGQIALGMPAHITSNNFPGRAFEGKVTRTSRAIDPQTRTLKVEVDVPNPDLTLMPGMYANVRFDISRSSLLEVPASAIVFRSTTPQVAVVDNDGKIRFRNVAIAVDDGSIVDVGSGIAAGDRVALNISSQVTDGELVKAVDTDKAPLAQSPDHSEPVASIKLH